jgi:hypothetical protein
MTPRGLGIIPWAALVCSCGSHAEPAVAMDAASLVEASTLADAAAPTANESGTPTDANAATAEANQMPGDANEMTSDAFAGDGPRGATLAPGWYLVAIDTPTRTYVDYVEVGASGVWQPGTNGWPQLAIWEKETTATATRFVKFTPGDMLTPAQIMAFLPATARASQIIDITSDPYKASPGSSDASAAIQAALDHAKGLASVGHPVDVIVPPGTFNHSKDLVVPAYVRLRGDGGGILYATSTKADNTGTGAVNLSGDGSGALFLTLKWADAGARGGTPDDSGIWVGGRVSSGANAYVVHDTIVVGNDVSDTTSAHVFGMSEEGGLWAFNYAHDGYADAFHHTGGSNHCQVIGNRASGPGTRGDDLYAFVGYDYDPDPVHHCSCIANWGQNGYARGISAVGAGFLSVQNNVIATTQAAGIYVAQEDGYATYGSFSVQVVRNEISGANQNSSHDGLLAYASSPATTKPTATFGSLPNAIRDLTLQDNTFTDTAAGIGNGYGIEVRSTCDGGVVTGNTVTHAKAPGIVVDGTSFTVSSNTFVP